jgi:hypothetical protein
MYEDALLSIEFLDQLDAKWLSYGFFKFVGKMVGGGGGGRGAVAHTLTSNSDFVLFSHVPKFNSFR